MKAVRLRRFGGPDALRLEETERPEPMNGEALVRVRAAGVNPVDYKIREGRLPAVKAENLPVVLGRDVAGVVELCGPGVSCKAGDEVYAMLGMDRGGYAEYVVVRTGEFAEKPTNLNFLEAAAVPLAGLTAWQGLFDQGVLEEGQRVLIHGGAGGVGHFAIQFAKAKGAWVATTVSAADIDFARSLGADQVIDYQAGRFEEVVGTVDLVFDLVGGETQTRSWAVMRDGGSLVSTLQRPDETLARERKVRARTYTTRSNASELSEITRVVEQGWVRPRVQSTFPLAEAADAQRALEKEHTRGKTVLAVTA